MDRCRYVAAFAVSVGVALALSLTACGGGDDAPPEAPPPVVTPPPPGTLIGAAGGTVTGPAGTSVVIPAGALASEVRILIEQSTTGAPPLPSGFSLAGQTFALTPHGTTFATPVTVTLPFNPATVPAGVTPVFYKTTNNQTVWQEIAGAVFGPSSVSVQVTSFSIAGVVLPPLSAGLPSREWHANILRGDALVEEEIAHDGSTSGPLNLIFDFGGILPWPGGVSVPLDGFAVGDITASEDGADWSLGTESPTGFGGVVNDPIGSSVDYKQTMSFHKRTENATLSITFKEAFLETVDANGILGRGCPGVRRNGLACDMILAELYVHVEAFLVPEDIDPDQPFDVFFRVAGGATLMGIAGSWSSNASTARESWVPLWNVEDFDFTVDALGEHEEAHITMQLRAPRTIQVDLSSVPTGQPFTLQSFAFVRAYNRAVAASEFATGARAFLRDPLSFEGATVVHTGLDVIEPVESDGPNDAPVTPAACTPGPAPDPSAGTLQFAAANYTQLESNGTPLITVTRTGGTRGAVTATISSSDGTAVAGVDYTALNTSVFFADGDATPRTLAVRVTDNNAHSEPDKTVNLTLSQPGGCAAIGTPATTVVTLRDDDAPPPPPTFTISGTVSGLVGTGLVLQDLHFRPITPGNGAFTMPSPTRVGDPFAVTVLTQPINPVQVCTVVNGSGTMPNAPVTNVLVNCVTPQVSGALDLGFGGTGKVSSPFGGDDTRMVLQPDGKIIMVGGNAGTGSNFLIARYDTDGSLDESFGGAGTGFTTTDIAGGADEALGVALQSDGRIIVVGSARVGSNDDFAVVRYDTNGVLDATFGTLGKVTTDFAGDRDRAFAVAVQPDDRIVVVGDAIMPAPGNTDFAVARYTANGAPDPTFDGDGRLTADIGGGVDIAQSVLLQGNQGAILVSGVLTLGNSPSLEHGGIARFTSSGALDTSFATAGKRTFPSL
ncbi:MAG TPA: Calx-beta domain-containing protein, partial [Steroidobacteraceae bacterium]